MKKYSYLIGTSCAIININSGSCRNENEGSKSKSNKKPDPLKGNKDILMAILKFKNDNMEAGESITITKKQITEAKSAEEIKNLKQQLEKIKTKPVGPNKNVVIDPNSIDLSQPYILKVANLDSGEKATNFMMLVNNGELLEQNIGESDDDFMARGFNNVYVLAKLSEKEKDLKNFFNNERDKYLLYVDPNTLKITGYNNKQDVEVSEIEDLKPYVGTYILSGFNELSAIDATKDGEALISPIKVTVYSKPSA